MYKKILVAIDGSETSKLALAEAVRLAKAFQSTIRAVYIVDSPAMLFDVGYYDPTELRKSFIQAGTALLADTAATLTSAGLQQETVLVETQNVGEDVAGALQAEAVRSGADVVVIGTHGRRGLAHAMLGSVAEKFIRQATTPVLLVRGPAKG
ncbi:MULTISPECIES: universal stress protein [Ralstonia]|uniref:Universal stress protein n=1 Tax=Ralstonia mojiangensis TaxID=2953895 RepID=A0AAE3LEZ0_9RALS|nr:universal stress protein [Ralstonia mojiangensis]MCO5413907.1 universal stress protein [Ralstonia mojiangensis]MCT7298563.1 universal stress protein [Ralstonia mojiangensis]MCT7311793.1 universal stress protein [Ralstonia mojiangensis]MCT7317766.1 universal stress protein [Ralstonia mojiangensis]